MSDYKRLGSFDAKKGPSNVLGSVSTFFKKHKDSILILLGFIISVLLFIHLILHFVVKSSESQPQELRSQILETEGNVTTRCRPNEYKDPDGNCKECRLGYYCDGHSETICPEGYFCKDGVKTRCGKNQYAPMGHSECTDQEKCKDGHVHKTRGTVTRERVCEKCEAGTYAYNDQCLTCPEKHRCIDGIKIKCKEDEYAPLGSTMCIPYSTCDRGVFPDAKPDGSDVNCNQYCPNGMYMDSSKKCRTCPEGYYCRDFEKTQCSDGFYQDELGQSECKGLKTCERGEYVTKEPNSDKTFDRTCAECKPGTYSDTANQSECKTCQTTPCDPKTGAATTAS